MAKICGVAKTCIGIASAVLAGTLGIASVETANAQAPVPVRKSPAPAPLAVPPRAQSPSPAQLPAGGQPTLPLVQFVQQGPKLVVLGTAAALSADGSTAVVREGSSAAWGPAQIAGCPCGTPNAARVFTRSGATWSQQVEFGPDVGTADVGDNPIALSADGNTFIVGGPAYDSAFGSDGAAWVFSRSGTAWSPQSQKLVGTPIAKSGATDDSKQGEFVALSADGNTALVGAPHDGNDAGAAWIFSRAAGAWSQQAKLVGSGAIGFQPPFGSQQGSGVALSSDGNSAVVSGPLDGAIGDGSVWTFTRSSGIWSQFGAKQEGFKAAAFSPGANAMIACRVSMRQAIPGQCFSFSRNGAVWTQQAAFSTPGPCLSASGGCSIALSDDGNTAIVGEPYGAPSGAARLYSRSGGIWSQLGPNLVGAGAIGTSIQFGSWVALSADGNTVLVGAPSDNGGAGAAWVFVRAVQPASVPPPQAGVAK